MRGFIVFILLICSNLAYSQSLQIINDNDFSLKEKQAFVLFKIRINDFTGIYTSEQVEEGKFIPLSTIIKYDNLMTKKWDTPINSAFYINERIKGGTWKKMNKLSVYEWFFLLEAEPDNDGYLFEYITLRSSSDKPVKIPVLRLIYPQNNTLINYGTIDVTITNPDRKIFVKIVNDNNETIQLTNVLQQSYPKIYDAYKDKVLNDKFKFFFVDRQESVSADFSMKSFFHLWENSDAKLVNILHDKMVFDSKDGEKPYASITFKEFEMPINFDIIYKSDWVKGEDIRPYGLVVANSDENKYFFQTNNEGKSKIEGTQNFSNEPFEIAYDLGKVYKKNDYKVEVRDRTATYYINSNKIGTCELNNSLSDTCKIDFMVYDKQKVIFYDFQIIEQ